MLTSHIKKLVLSSAFICFANTSYAETLWSDNSFTYLKNTSEFSLLTNDDIDVFTFEHVSGHNWGDVFFFIDRTNASKDANNAKYSETYGEVSARLSLSYLSDKKLAYGLVSDVFIAGTYEHSTSNTNGAGFSFDNYLVGVGASWQLFEKGYFNTNIYRANNEVTDNDYQLTVTWGTPLVFGKHHIMFDGYIDWSSSADDHSADFHFNPQLRLDVGRYFDHADFFEMGIEYSYWDNKYGVSNADTESVVSLLVKVHL